MKISLSKEVNRLGMSTDKSLIKVVSIIPCRRKMFGEHSQKKIPKSALEENVFVNYNATFTLLDGLQNPHNYQQKLMN